MVVVAAAVSRRRRRRSRRCVRCATSPVLLLEYLENAARRRRRRARSKSRAATGRAPIPRRRSRRRGRWARSSRELPDPHAPRVDALLPALLAPPPGCRRKNKGGPTDPGIEPATSICVDAPAAALTARFLLPYLLQSTEDPHGLEAFERARGPAARKPPPSSSRVVRQRQRRGVRGGVRGASRRRRGVVTAVCAVLRNAMEGTDRGACGGDARRRTRASRLADCAGAMSEWAERVLERDRSTRWTRRRRGGWESPRGGGLARLRRDGAIVEGARGRAGGGVRRRGPRPFARARAGGRGSGAGSRRAAEPATCRGGRGGSGTTTATRRSAFSTRIRSSTPR